MQLNKEAAAALVEAFVAPSPEKMFGNGARIESVPASERYSELRYAAKHAKTGLPVYDPILGCEVSQPSQASKARAGVLLKHLARKAGVLSVPPTDHERHLLGEVIETKRWAGKLGTEYVEDVRGSQVKSLIDDATSGGLEITPIEFDSDVITFPLLSGELFPFVDLKPVPRGRRIEGGSIGTPTLSWGDGDDTAITPFTTTSMVAAIDTTIFPVGGGILVGRDFLSDSPMDVGSTLTALIGERLQAELDKMIAIGNGTTQPEGIFTASGLTTVTAGGTTTSGNYQSLLFSLEKQYRTPQMRATFLANDITYQRARAIPVGASDARLLFGMDIDSGSGAGVENYQILGRRYAIQNDVDNAKAAIVCLAKYRMYRRMGLEIRFETGGKELATKNLALLVYRARFGGRLIDTNAAAKWTDGPS